MYSILNLQKISKKYGAQFAVNEVSFEIKRGEICGLVGENGAGKTTLLRMLSGLSKPTSGKIVTHCNYKVGALIESPAIYPNLSAIDNLKYMAFQLNLEENEKQIFKILNIVGLAGVDPKKKSKDFSLGMRQRLAIALAILDNPDFLILDEPINGLDPIGIKEMRNIILNLRDSYHMTILISSHILSELELVVDRYVIMHQGKVVKELSKKQLHQQLEEQLYLKTNDFSKTEQILLQHKIRFNQSDSYFVLSENLNTMSLLNLLLENKIDLEEIFKKKVSFEDYYLKLITQGE